MILQKLDADSQRIIRRAGAPRITCKAGCAACCQQWIPVQWPEIELVALYSAARGLDPDMGRMAKQLEHMSSGPITRFEWFKAGHRCVWLDEHDRCKVYPVRPIACRSLLVVGDSANCAKGDAITMHINNESAVNLARAKMQTECLAMMQRPIVVGMPFGIHVWMCGKTSHDIVSNNGIVGLAARDGKL